MVVILMGAAGSGKTTVGRALAAALGWPFADGDDYHSKANIAKMLAGVPLTDADRAAWLAALHGIAARAVGRREPLVLACSALKERYRETLRGQLRAVRFVYLQATDPLLRSRLEDRRGHFAGPQLVPSQLADLEEPSDALVIDASAPVDDIVSRVRHEFGL